jgi:hypothetical protein
LEACFGFGLGQVHLEFTAGHQMTLNELHWTKGTHGARDSPLEQAVSRSGEGSPAATGQTESPRYEISIATSSGQDPHRSQENLQSC